MTLQNGNMLQLKTLIEELNLDLEVDTEEG